MYKYKLKEIHSGLVRNNGKIGTLLEIAMYPIEGRLNKQINDNIWNACLFCVSTLLRALHV